MLLHVNAHRPVIFAPSCCQSSVTTRVTCRRHIMKQLEDNIYKGDKDDKLSDNILGDGHSATENVIP